MSRRNDCMNGKVMKTAACALLGAFFLSGCSYLPAKAPELTTADQRTLSSEIQTSDPSAQTAPSDTTAPNPADAAVKAYTDFISGNNKVSTSGCFDKDSGRSYFDLTYGTYSLEEMKKAVRFDSGFGSTARYVVIDCGKDGMPELAVCLELLDHGTSSVICIIGYDNGTLVMNSIIEEKVPNEYMLYDSGYIESATIPFRGMYKMVLIKVENGGKCSEVFTYSEYQGSLAANIIKHLRKSEEETGTGFENIPNDFIVREFVSEGKVVISVGEWSGSESDKALEEQLVSRLKTLGAEVVSDEKMKELASTKEYLTKEVAWTDCSSETAATSSAGIAKVAGNFQITVYMDPESSEYTGLGNVVHALNSGNGTDMRFVCDSDDVTVILEKGAWDMNSDVFAPEREIFNVQVKAGLVYQFNCVPGDVFPYYRIRAVKGSFSAEWLVLRNKDNKMTVIKSSFKGA